MFCMYFRIGITAKLELFDLKGLISLRMRIENDID